MRKQLIIELLLCGLLSVFLFACNGNRPEVSNKEAGPEKTVPAFTHEFPYFDRFPHESKFVHVNGINLNYLDWGGKGVPLVMIHGIADSPHIFDDLANLLAPHYRVIAYARRGHASSDAPADGPYSLAAYVEDLRQLLDSLHIQKAHLLGWSMGGNEITMFAGLYPERVEKLIYLESGYDWTDPVFLESFGRMWMVNIPDSSDFELLPKYGDWFHSAWIGKETPWTAGLEAYIHDVIDLDSNINVVPLPNEQVFTQLFASLASPPRDYTKVQAPALALYSPVFFPSDVGKAEITRHLNDWEQEVMKPFRAASIARLQREMKNVQIKQIDNTTHMSIGIYQVDSLANILRQFLN